jgi:hypothetical protein
LDATQVGLPPGDAAEKSVRQAIAEYVAAYNSMDVRSVQRVKPSFKGYSSSLRSTVLSISDPVIKVSPDQRSATVTLTVKYQNTFAKGMPGLAVNPPPQVVTWRLEQTTTRWIILE